MVRIMSTPSSPPTRVAFSRWIDDAAVFPPGNAPVADAWRAHVELLDGGYGDLVGPLLVGVAHVDELVDVATAEPRGERDGDETVVDVAVIARAGIPVSALLDAAGRLTAAAGSAVRLHAVEVAHDGSQEWRGALDLDVPLAVELPRTGWEAGMDDLAAATRGRPRPPVLAKLRTQATADASPPSAEELAAFLAGAHERVLPVKLTGGLHHALPTEVKALGGDEHHEHGALGVLVAAHAVARGTSREEVLDTLRETDPAPLVAAVRSWTRQDMEQARSALASFGCCGVLDPIQDLVGLGLLPEAPAGPRPDRRAR